jgi:hypothetical protein
MDGYYSYMKFIQKNYRPNATAKESGRKYGLGSHKKRSLRRLSRLTKILGQLSAVLRRNQATTIAPVIQAKEATVVRKNRVASFCLPSIRSRTG